MKKVIVGALMVGLGAIAHAQADVLPVVTPPAGAPAEARPLPDHDLATPPDASIAGKKKKKKKVGKVHISGVLSVLYKFRIDEDDDGQREPDNFRLGKARVNFDGQVTDEVGYVVEIDPRSPTILGVVRDAYLTFKVIPHHEIRLGQQKTQFGWENRQSSTRLYTITRSELSESLGRGITLRDIGVGLIGKWPLGEELRLEDAVTLVNGNGLGFQDDDTQRKNLWGRVGARYLVPQAELSVRLGVSGAIGDQLTEVDPGETPERFEFTRLGLDLELEQRWAFFVAEYAHGWDEIPHDSGDVEKSSAWYAELVGRTPWQVGPVVRYDTWDAEDFSRLTAGAYWGEPDAPFRIIVHYEHFKDEAGRHDGRVLSLAQVRF